MMHNEDESKNANNEVDSRELNNGSWKRFAGQLTKQLTPLSTKKTSH
jgi:hypothetical protein